MTVKWLQFNVDYLQNHRNLYFQVRSGMVKVSDGKTRPTPMRLHLSMEVLKLQKEEVTPVNRNQNQRPLPKDSRVSWLLV